MDTCWISVGIGQFMMQVAQLGPNLRLLAEMRSGAGLLQGQKIWWNYKVDSQRYLLEGMMFLYGRIVQVSIIVLIPGML
jgi:hypothetical protein